MRFSSQRSQLTSHPQNLSTLSAINEDEPESDGQWWRPATLFSAIVIVVVVHWWILH
jgi:hypothetical protein